MKRKVFRALVCLVFCCYLCSIVSFARETTLSISQIAEQTIIVDNEVNEDGVVITTYSNLDEFVLLLRECYSDMSDYEVARQLLMYTGQDPDKIPVEDAIDMLAYDNVSSATQFVVLDEAGESETYAVLPRDVWIDNSGVMKITTDFTYTGTYNGEEYYTVWSLAEWINYPAICLEDVFVLGTSGTFNSSKTERGYVHQTFLCNDCGRYTYWNRDVDKNNTVDDDLEMEYVNTSVPALRFAPTTARCEYCGGYEADDTYFGVYLQYGLISNGSCVVQAAYGHKKLGVGSLSISIGYNGEPSISAWPSVNKDVYNARPVTVQYSGGYSLRE